MEVRYANRTSPALTRSDYNYLQDHSRQRMMMVTVLNWVTLVLRRRHIGRIYRIFIFSQFRNVIAPHTLVRVRARVSHSSVVIGLRVAAYLSRPPRKPTHTGSADRTNYRPSIICCMECSGFSGVRPADTFPLPAALAAMAPCSAPPPSVPAHKPARRRLSVPERSF